MHGMPVAFLLGLIEGAQNYPGFGWFRPCVKPSDIIYIGLRDLDKGEKRIIKKLGIKAYTVSFIISYNDYIVLLLLIF